LAGVLDLSLDSPHRRVSGSPQVSPIRDDSPHLSNQSEAVTTENSSLLTTVPEAACDILIDTNPVVTLLVPTALPSPQPNGSQPPQDMDADDLFGL
jgi:hypothetical protein